MQKDSVICTFNAGDKPIDIEVPLFITCDEFIRSMNEAMKLNMVIPGEGAFFRMENPVALIRGDKLLADTGIRNGSSIFYGRNM